MNTWLDEFRLHMILYSLTQVPADNATSVIVSLHY